MGELKAKKATSWGTRPMEDIELTVKGDFRRVIRPVLDQETGELREFKLIVQRKSPREKWSDVKIPANLTSMKAGEIKSLNFAKEEAQALIGHLNELAQIAGLDLSGDGQLTMAALPKNKAEIIPLLEADDTYLTQILKEKPQLADTMRLQYRREGLAEFKEKLEKSACKEDDWKDFFVRHKWVFGLGLELKYLEELQIEATVGGAGLSGAGSARADGMLATCSESSRYTVALEIKTSQTKLLEAYKGREKGGAWKASYELGGGIAQVQNYCYRWEKEGQYSDLNMKALDGITTVWPKGVLVIGHTAEFEGEPMKVKAFHRLRESLHAPTIITFDELYQRAKFIVEDEVNNG